MGRSFAALIGPNKRIKQVSQNLRFYLLTLPSFAFGFTLCGRLKEQQLRVTTRDVVLW